MRPSTVRGHAALSRLLVLSALIIVACGSEDASPASSPSTGPAAGAGGRASLQGGGGGSAGQAGSGQAGSGPRAGGASARAGQGGGAGNASGGSGGAGLGGGAAGVSGATSGGNASGGGTGGLMSAGSAGTGAPGGGGATNGGSGGSTSGGGKNGGGSAGSANGGSAGGPPADVCASTKTVCPAPGGLKEHGGLLDIDRCAFPITEQGFASYEVIVAAIEEKKLVQRVGVANVLADLNRTGKAIGAAAVPGNAAGIKHAFGWEDGDQNVDYWIPQGLTGSTDGSASANGQIGGKSVLVISWYYDIDKDPGSKQKKGVRLAFVDATNPAKPAYRFVLLVEPTGTAVAPSYGPVNVHAGGIAWVGDMLYVADTGNGFRVFDFTHIWDVGAGDAIGCAGTACTAAGYAYAIPQIGRYKAEDTCSLLFSYVSLDKSTSPPSLVSGEYCNDACSGPLAGRLARWPLDPLTGRLSGGTSWPAAAHVMQQRQVQGAASRNGVFYLSSSAPSGAGGELYRVTKGKSKTSGFIDTPEDLLVDEPGKLLWSLSEGTGARYVMGAALSSYPAP